MNQAHWLNQRTRKPRTIGDMVLIVYLLIVVGLAILHDLTGLPHLSFLASSPSAMLHGKWWSLFTSGLIVDGPIVPQVLVVALLCAFGIFFRSSWIFWGSAALGHIFGTLLTYLGVGLVWLANPNLVRGLIGDPDYGISLVWCAGLGVVAGVAWFGTDRSLRRPYRPFVAFATLILLGVITTFSDGLAVYEHLVAFAIGVMLVQVQHRRIIRLLAARLPRRRQT